MTDDLLRSLDERIAQLKDEAARLEAAREALAPQAPQAPKRRGPRRKADASGAQATRQPRSKAEADGNGTTSRRRGQFQERLLELVRKHPEGLTVSEMAKELGCDPKQPYLALKKAAERGEVVKEAKTWKPVEA